MEDGGGEAEEGGLGGYRNLDFGFFGLYLEVGFL